MRTLPSFAVFGLLLCVGTACSKPPSTPLPATAAVTPTGEEAPIYGAVRPSADGIGKTYQGREISAVMGWQGAAWLEREEREREERGSLLLQELALTPGMAVADVGAGTGYYARRMAPLVAPGGVIYAVDVQPQMVAMLERPPRSRGSTTSCRCRPACPILAFHPSPWISR